MNNLPLLHLVQNNDNKNNEYIIFRNDFKYKKNNTKKTNTEKIRKKNIHKKNNTKKNKKTYIFKIF
jgi:hypothetical protein